MRILAENTFAIFIDYQEKLMPVIKNNEAITKKTVTLMQGLKELGIDYLVSQQYTKGLGETVTEIREAVDDFSYMEKGSFSCMDTKELKDWVKSHEDKKTVIVCGVEAHICVLQTVVDLLAEGYYVFVVADCVGSRADFDMEIGLKRIQDEGAFLTTTESVLFEMTQGSTSPHFRTISKLIK